MSFNMTLFVLRNACISFHSKMNNKALFMLTHKRCLALKGWRLNRGRSQSLRSWGKSNAIGKEVTQHFCNNKLQKETKNWDHIAWTINFEFGRFISFPILLFKLRFFENAIFYLNDIIPFIKFLSKL